jgi:hypothetical protein
LVSFIAQKGAQTGYKISVMLSSNGCFCKAGESSLSASQQEQIIVVRLPAHTSDQVKSVNLGVFGDYIPGQSLYRRLSE